MTRRFRDRVDAGRLLAPHLEPFRPLHPVVLGLPRGGVPVAHEIAEALAAPLDVVLVRKLGAPGQPELAIGAIGEGGVRVLNAAVLRGVHVSAGEMADIEARERGELERRARRYRGDRPGVLIAGRAVIVVDDGLATGSTARAAIGVVRARGAERVVLAVPVAPRATVRELESVADAVVAVATPARMRAVGTFYDDFTQTSDAEVVRLLQE